MTDAKDADTITGYHAHVYFDDASRESAAWLRDQVALRFSVVLGRWREEPVGPHPRPMYQIAFKASEFEKFVPWLMLNRRDLVIFVHPETGDDVADHDVYPLWLGEKLDLDIDMLRKFAAQQASN